MSEQSVINATEREVRDHFHIEPRFSTQCIIHTTAINTGGKKGCQRSVNKIIIEGRKKTLIKRRTRYLSTSRITEYTYVQPLNNSPKCPVKEKKIRWRGHLTSMPSLLVFLVAVRVRIVRDLGEPFALWDFALEWEDCIEHANGRVVRCLGGGTARRVCVADFIRDGGDFTVTLFRR